MGISSRGLESGNWLVRRKLWEIELPQAWYAQAKDWVEQRYGTCKQFHEDNIRKAFSNGYQNAATGRWELEGFKQDLSNMEGRRAAPAAPMALG